MANVRKTMATQREQSEPQPLEGEALVRAIMADKKLVSEVMEAQRRADAGETTWVPWEDIKREMDARRRQARAISAMPELH